MKFRCNKASTMKSRYCLSCSSQDCLLSEDGSELVILFNIVETMAVLTKCSFDENHRQPISNLGGIPAIADLIQVNLLRLFLCYFSARKSDSSSRSSVIFTATSACHRPTLNAPRALRCADTRSSLSPTSPSATRTSSPSSVPPPVSCPPWSSSSAPPPPQTDCARPPHTSSGTSHGRRIGPANRYVIMLEK